jgi:hypothetical protein
MQLHPEYSVVCNSKENLYPTVDKLLLEAEGASLNMLGLIQSNFFIFKSRLILNM